MSDTSPVRALALLGRLDLLESLFDDVRIPPAVVAELLYPKRGPVVDAAALPVLRIQAPVDRRRVAVLAGQVDVGESEAIALALEIEAEQLLVDDNVGRTVAEQFGIACVGTLGLLLRAKGLGQVSRISPLLERLDAELNFYMSDDLRRFILREAGESESPD